MSFTTNLIIMWLCLALYIAWKLRALIGSFLWYFFPNVFPRQDVYAGTYEDLPKRVRSAMADSYKAFESCDEVHVLGTVKIKSGPMNTIWACVWITSQRDLLLSITANTMTGKLRIQEECTCFRTDGIEVFTVNTGGLDLVKLYGKQAFQLLAAHHSPSEILEAHIEKYGRDDLVPIREQKWVEQLKELSEKKP